MSLHAQVNVKRQHFMNEICYLHEMNYCIVAFTFQSRQASPIIWVIKDSYCWGCVRSPNVQAKSLVNSRNFKMNGQRVKHWLHEAAENL